MSRAEKTGLFLLLLAVWCVLAVMIALKGGFYLAKHEGDTLHLVQIVLRMAGGDTPHLDFVTPIGIWAFSPMALLVRAGMGVGNAILWGQMLVAALMLPALWWVGASRMRIGPAVAFGVGGLLLIAALVHGEAGRNVSISVHYNRWAWAVAFVPLALVLLPIRGEGPMPVQGVRRAPVGEGVLIGLCMAALALIKATYFVAFAPAVLLGLVLRGQWRALWMAFVSGVAVVAVMTVTQGADFWAAYIGDLRMVAQSDVRPQPGLALSQVVLSPAYTLVTLVALACVMLLRRVEGDPAAFILFLLAPGFIYVTWQNYGNDPLWLFLVGLVMLSHRTDPAQGGRGDRRLDGGLLTTGAVALVLIAAPALNIGYSPVRHLTQSTERFSHLFGADARHDDIYVVRLRAARVDGVIPMDLPGGGLEWFRQIAERPEPTVLQGRTLRQCQLKSGVVALLSAIAADLEAEGYGGRRILSADIYGGLWLFGSIEPVPGAAPWYYGGLPGIEAAEYLVVPDCPIAPDVRRAYVEQIKARQIGLAELERTPLYTLYRIGGRGGAADE
ncbi:MAG: hypothetical protein RI566_03025 [Sediminimonas sp.]|uniref:hypothetical protein n=1 Tax=Sediminimonas sp. TaxID=2823379 RepID=UPI002870813D|nr:hypothetical protein [Sediminimonas sp.]MDR9484123.1 hypothetical protein [Sediminimonas sp.]